jgi:hypothetical protein
MARITSLIDWVHALAIEWGHWLRKAEARQSSIQGTLGRVRDEGPVAAAIRSKSDRIPCVDFPQRVNAFHRAWLSSPEEYRDILWLDYKRRLPAKEKIRISGLKKHTYYRKRAKAQAEIAGRIDQD